MNAGRLLALYDRVAEAPDAVPRLRRFVLDLAVRGKLVEQDPVDQPVPIEVEHEEHVRASHYDLPKNWRSATVGQALTFKYGKTLRASDRLREGPIPVFGSNGVVGFTDEPLTHQPSIIIGRKGSAGALNCSEGPSWTTDVAYFVEVPPIFCLRYLFIALASLHLDHLAKGVKPGLSRSDAYRLAISIPPLDEQHRIVTKVDEFMALCDRLEAKRNARRKARARLTTASFARLIASDADEASSRSHARFAVHALPELTARADQVQQLRQTILDLAVRGKLVEQDPADQPVPIEVEHEEHVRASHYDLPKNWRSATVGQALTFKYGKTLRASDRLREGPIPVFGSNGVVGFTDEPLTHQPSIIIGRKGSAGALNCSEGPSWTTDVAYFVEVPPIFCLRYLFIALASLHLDHLAKGVKPGLSRSDAYRLAISIPPLDEQHRIVTKVDEFMALCDQLQTALDTVVDHRNDMLKSLLQDVLTSSKKETEGSLHIHQQRIAQIGSSMKLRLH